MQLCQWFLVEDMILLLLEAVGMPRPERARRTAHSSHWGIHNGWSYTRSRSLLRFLDSKRRIFRRRSVWLYPLKKSAKYISFLENSGRLIKEALGWSKALTCSSPPG